MKQLLRILYAKCLIFLSIQTYAQSDTRSYSVGDGNQSVIPSIRQEVAEESISLYPNPGVDKLLVDVDLNQWQGGTITIKTRSGREIAHQRIVEASSGFNLSSINRGVYFLTVRRGGSERTVEIIKL